MKVLLINKYLYPRGGDAICTVGTGRLLQKHGHEVLYWGLQHPANPDLPGKHRFLPWVDYGQTAPLLKRIKEGMDILYNFSAEKQLALLLKESRPDLVHLHNFAHQLSPSVVQAVKRFSIPAVMTMHDYKLVCPVYLLFRNGRICEDCRGKRFYHCLLKRCTKHSPVKSLLNTLEMYLHHIVLPLYKKIDLFIAPSHFLRDKVKAMGFRGKISVLPNFIDPPDSGTVEQSVPQEGDSIVFAGRLSPEKGLPVLIAAVQGMKTPVKILGEGPLKSWLGQKLQERGLEHVRYLGYRAQAEARKEIGNSLFAVMPSVWYENCPGFILEAFAAGVPVVGSRLGGITELVREGQSGLTFAPGSASDLRTKMEWMLADRDRTREMGKKARQQILAENHPEHYYTRLLTLYRQVLAGQEGSDEQ